MNFLNSGEIQLESMGVWGWFGRNFFRGIGREGAQVFIGHLIRRKGSTGDRIPGGGGFGSRSVKKNREEKEGRRKGKKKK